MSPRAILLAGACLVGSACSFDPPPDIGSDARLDGSNGGIDASDIDAPIDAMLQPVYDVAFPEEWKFSIEGPISGYLLIINTSPNPLDLSTFEIVSVVDDHPTLNTVITAPTAFNQQLGPGWAAGSLSGLSQDVLVDSGIVTEGNFYPDDNFLTLGFENMPAGTYDFTVTLTLAVEGHEVAMPMVIHHIDDAAIWADPQVGKRVTVYQ